MAHGAQPRCGGPRCHDRKSSYLIPCDVQFGLRGRGMTTKPLQGLRVLDVSNFMAGPFCATQLGEFGAEIIKVELPGIGDPMRKFGTPTIADFGPSHLGPQWTMTGPFVRRLSCQQRVRFRRTGCGHCNHQRQYKKLQVQLPCIVYATH
jgi:hypothetical protein